MTHCTATGDLYFFGTEEELIKRTGALRSTQCIRLNNREGLGEALLHKSYERFIS